MNKITVSAPGKLMLFGEHAVVYDYPCIVTAVNQRMRATVELTDEPFFKLHAPDVAIKNYKKPISELGQGEISKAARFVEIAVKNFLQKFEAAPQSWQAGVRISTSSEFSSDFGFGSSSASTVCVIKALSELTGAKLDNKTIFDLAYKTVLNVQGKGSGFDVAAAIYGGTLYFMTGGKVIEPLKTSNLPLIVGYSGFKVGTTNVINQVSERFKKYPQIVDNIFTQVQQIVILAKKKLLSKDFQAIGELMNFNQGYLESLGVSSKKLADMIHSARDAGTYGAKLSGAGIGDCMIALAPRNKNKIKNAIISAGGQIMDIEINADGVRIE